MSKNKENNIKQFERLNSHFGQLNLNIKQGEMLNLESISIVSHRHGCKVNFFNSNTSNAINEFPNSLALVFASAKNPGGGVLRGSIAQEEDISRTTTWYFQVKDNPFYSIKHKDLMYSSSAVYVKNCYLLMDDYGNIMNPKNISLIGIAAPNLKGMYNNNSKIDINSIYQVYKQRLRYLFSFAKKENYENLILGAWGCGVFGLDTAVVASIYNEVINEKLYTGNVVFAIPDINVLTVFQNKIKDH